MEYYFDNFRCVSDEDQSQRPVHLPRHQEEEKKEKKSSLYGISIK